MDDDHEQLLPGDGVGEAGAGHCRKAGEQTSPEVTRTLNLFGGVSIIVGRFEGYSILLVLLTLFSSYVATSTKLHMN